MRNKNFCNRAAQEQGIDPQSPQFKDLVRQEIKSIVDWSRMGAAVATLLAGREVNVGIETATNALENNFLATNDPDDLFKAIFEKNLEEDDSDSLYPEEESLSDQRFSARASKSRSKGKEKALDENDYEDEEPRGRSREKQAPGSRRHSRDRTIQNISAVEERYDERIEEYQRVAQNSENSFFDRLHHAVLTAWELNDRPDFHGQRQLYRFAAYGKDAAKDVVENKPIHPVTKDGLVDASSSVLPLLATSTLAFKGGKGSGKLSKGQQVKTTTKTATANAASMGTTLDGRREAKGQQVVGKVTTEARGSTSQTNVQSGSSAQTIAGDLKARLQLNKQNGQLFQGSVHDHLRIPENKKAYTISVQGKGSVTTIPDLPINYGITDIKNVQYITFTKQLQAQAALAKQQGTSFNVIISPNTQKVAKQVRKEVEFSGGKFFEYNSATQTMVERIIEGNKVIRPHG